MANSLGTLTSSLIIQRALELVFTKRPVLNSISLGLQDLDGEVRATKLGQSVITRIKSIPTVSTFATATPNDITTTDVSVTLNTEKQVYAKFTRAETQGTARNLIDDAAEPIAVALSNAFIDAIAGLWLIGNFTTTAITVASGWTYANTLLAMRNAFAVRGVPDANRFFAMLPSVYGALLADTTVVAALNNPSNGDAIRTGKLPQVASFGLDEYAALPTTANKVGFAGTPDSTVFALRPHQDPTTISGIPFSGNFGIVTEPRTGLSVDVTEWIDQQTLDINIRIGWMYGIAVGNANNGQLLITS